MKKERISAPAVGGSPLLVIFAVLCLTVFALLSLSTVQAERRMADTAAKAVTDYYTADLQAQKIFARLRTGEMVDAVTVAGDTYRYSCVISKHQALEVTLQKEDDTWRVCRWQVCATAEEISETLPVWDGK